MSPMLVLGRVESSLAAIDEGMSMVVEAVALTIAPKKGA